MDIEIIPLVSFVFATTFSPGPNNISSASMGVTYGYRKTVSYLIGVASGFFLVMMACAFLSSSLLTLLPASEKYLRGVGAAYIVWLALGTLRSKSSFSETRGAPKAFTKGFVLQLFNPKVAVYGLTLFSTFLSSISGDLYGLSLFALCFALTAFISISTWALCGAMIKNKLKNERFRRGVNLFLFLLLLYTAADLSGILNIGS
ncbi:LysE family translocator [Desulfospira joergensenii]|uniref:LysE family translocator n=1 Tax=Desulfospira joergensenii TaxID=53329 RepID=UPI0003B45B5B|nr:LysE family translocator [Desulfospira joergensenii]